jgi:translocation protein SEC62
MGDAAADGDARASASRAALEEQLRDVNQVRRMAKFLHATIPLREAVQLSKRVNYFRGKKLYEVLLDKAASSKDKPACESEEEARLVGIALLQHGLIHASMVSDKKKRELRPVQTLDFSDEGYYTWIFEGSKTMRNLLLSALVFSLVAMCLFPIWPARAKVGIWYAAVTLIIFLFVLFTVRLVVYIMFWTVGYEFWILPNFFDETLGVADSFRPIVSFGKAEDLKESWPYRGGGLFLVLAFAYWCTQQPTEFDELYSSQMDFLSELYDGKLLRDPAKEDIIKEKAIPKMDDLKKAIELEEMGADPDQKEEEDTDKKMEELLNKAEESADLDI